jgi:hypothetical protein
MEGDLMHLHAYLDSRPLEVSAKILAGALISRDLVVRSYYITDF